MSETKITYRGWPGHFIAARYCVFRLNSLVEVNGTRYVVSTVGNEQLRQSDGSWKDEELRPGCWYETMVFKAALINGYWDQESGTNIPLMGKWTVNHLDLTSDQEAQDMHDAAVKEIVARIEGGELH